MRRRLASLIDQHHDFCQQFAELAELELGIEGPWSGTRDWKFYLDKWALQDVLDLVTIGYRHGRGVDETTRRFSNLTFRTWWVTEVRRILAEENVHYTVDDQGGVHFAFDAEFTRATVSTIKALDLPQLSNYRALFESALTAMASAPLDGRDAIRKTFAAIEGLFRTMYPDVERLASKATDRLKPRLLEAHAGDKPAIEASERMLLALRDWIDAAHECRHEQGRPEAAQPPLPVTIHLVSVGAAHLRWLAELYRR